MSKRILSFVLTVLMLFTFAACGTGGGGISDGNGTEGEKAQVWYMGGHSLLYEDVDVESLFEDVTDSVDAEKIYSSVEWTEEMLHGAYTLNNRDKDIKAVRKEIPFEDVTFDNGTFNLTVLPTAVYFGKDTISNIDTGFKYGEFKSVTDCEVAVIEFATADDFGQLPCIYEVDGNSVTFKDITETSGEDEPLSYEYTGLEFKYTFEICGPYLTLSKGDVSLKLKAYCMTDNTDDDLAITGYSLPDSPLVGDLDYFAASKRVWNYAAKRDGSFYDISAYKFDDTGKFTFYLYDKDSATGEEVVFTEQYAYIIQSSANTFFIDFGIILLDGTKAYYYTDNISKREARILEDQGADVSEMTEDEIKQIAEKKSDLYDDLYKEFEAQGINVTINRSTGEIAMDASVLFGGDSAVVTADGKALLDKFLAAYTKIIYNEKYDGFISKTMVEGHIAPVAGTTYESGMPLSEQRANNVKDYCANADIGVDLSKLASTLEAVGFSNSKPVYDSNGNVDMAACRRVSFRLIVNVDEQG